MARRHQRTAYLARVMDGVLTQRLASAGAVLVEGPRACGKTYTAEQASVSQVYLDIDERARTALALDPALVLSAPSPLLIDEWQIDATTVWNHVRHEVDRRGTVGQFILTGSSVPDDDASRHTGAGRIARLRMRPMALAESGESSGAMSLSALITGERPRSRDTDLTVPMMADLVVRGGWPLNLSMPMTAAIQANRDYLANMTDVDIVRVDRSRSDPARARRLLRALARNTGQDHKVARLAAEAEGDVPLARSTAYDYLAAFERLLILELVPAFSANLRSRTVLRTAARTHVVDPSLAAAALMASPHALLTDLKTFGFLFESLVVRDVRIYSEPLGGIVHHYRDSDNLEIDIVLTTNESWGAFEVKLGNRQIDEAAEHLLAFSTKVDPSKMGRPSVLGVITGTGYGYTRPDGVVVIPIGALGP